MKGISPMLATILLVAFTVAVGGMISLWMSGFFSSTQAGTEARTTALTKCSNARFSIMSARGTSSNATVITHYSNDLNVYPQVVRFSDGTINTTFTPKTAIAGGSIATLNAQYPTGVTFVTVSGSCEYGTVNVSVEASCRKGEDCWVG
jgi:flagellin-like protein